MEIELSKTAAIAYDSLTEIDRRAVEKSFGLLQRFRGNISELPTGKVRQIWKKGFYSFRTSLKLRIIFSIKSSSSKIVIFDIVNKNAAVRLNYSEDSYD